MAGGRTIQTNIETCESTLSSQQLEHMQHAANLNISTAVMSYI